MTSTPKTSEYLNWLDDHIIGPSRQDELACSCTAVCLLLFAAADALGGLVHENEGAGNRERFELFLERAGTGYYERREYLWRLRNSLFHEGLAAGTLLSREILWSSEHLAVTEEDHILLNTRELAADFRRAFEELRSEIATSPLLAERAEDRLETASDCIFEHSESTPPPPIEFKYVRKRRTT